MKTTLIILASLIQATAYAQYLHAHMEAQGEQHSQYSSGSVFDGVSTQPPVVYTPNDPNRAFGTNTYRLAGVDPQHGFVAFQGTVIHSDPNVIVISGSFTGCDGTIVFGVSNFPYIYGDQQKISVGDNQKFYVARLAGTYTYTDHYGNSQNVRLLDYGTICVPKPKDAATLKAEADKHADSVARALKANQDMADKGDEYGLLRMGERYRDGEGFDKDLAKAKDYLTKAAASGSPTAQSELAALNK